MNGSGTGFKRNSLIEIDESRNTSPEPVNDSGMEVIKDDDNHNCGNSSGENDINKDNNYVLTRSQLIDFIKSNCKPMIIKDDTEHPIKYFISLVLKGVKITEIFNVVQIKSIFSNFIKINTGESLVKRIITNSEKVVIVGDIHGYLESLNNVLFDVNNYNYIFLGDYIDRGPYQLECLLFIYLLKTIKPSNVLLLRGNHEATRCENFLNSELIEKLCGCDDDDINEIKELAYKSFDYLDMFTILDDHIMCVHGGVPSNFSVVEELMSKRKPYTFKHEIKINKLLKVAKRDEHEENVLELLWNDPGNTEERFIHNEYRKGYKIFNKVATLEFFKQFNDKVCKDIKLDLIIRGHEFLRKGFNLKPNVLTIFSAYEYCNSDNFATFLIYENSKFNIVIFFKDGDNFVRYLIN